jgi:hypothetical protein
MTYETSVAKERIKNLSIAVIEENGARNILRLQDYHEFSIGIVDVAVMDNTMPEYIEAGQYLRYIPIVILPKHSFK